MAESIRETCRFVPAASVRTGTLGVIGIAGTAVTVADNAYPAIGPNLMRAKTIEEQEAEEKRENRRGYPFDTHWLRYWRRVEKQLN